MLSRKRNRLKNYDYSQCGKYFITVCVKDRHNILCDIQNVGGGVPDAPVTVILSDLGTVCEDVIKSINNNYDNVKISKYVIMPNHIHMIVDVLKCGSPRTTNPTLATVPWVVSTFKRFISKKAGFQFFQRSYHDHIIRNEQELNEIYNYIEYNPLNWKDDILNTK